jgi:hypothetical protein
VLRVCTHPPFRPLDFPSVYAAPHAMTCVLPAYLLASRDVRKWKRAIGQRHQSETSQKRAPGKSRRIDSRLAERTHGPIAEARRSATQTKQAQALREWNPSDLPKWLDEDAYHRDILPRLSKFTVKAIRLKLGVSHPYATLVRRGVKIPHPRHWLALARLTGVSPSLTTT